MRLPFRLQVLLGCHFSVKPWHKAELKTVQLVAEAVVEAVAVAEVAVAGVEVAAAVETDVIPHFLLFYENLLKEADFLFISEKNFYICYRSMKMKADRLQFNREEASVSLSLSGIIITTTTITTP